MKKKKKKREPYKQLSYEDRFLIYKLLKHNENKKYIAETLGVHISTIYREIKRGLVKQIDTHLKEYIKYDPYTSNERSKINRAKRGANLKLILGCEYLEFVKEKIIKDKFSPRAVVMYIKINEVYFEKTLSDFSIYRYIRLGLIDGLTLKHLHYTICKNKYIKHQRKRGASGVSIEKRPKEVLERNEFGHWEMDTVVGKQGESKKSLLVLTERKTRYEIIFTLEEHTTENVVTKINCMEKFLKNKFYKIFKSITVDNGSEFCDSDGIVKSILHKNDRVKLYYCHPYCSCERGTNENTNRLIRYFIPKGINFDNKTEEDIKAIQKWINNYPRKIHNGQNAKQKIIKELKSIKINYKKLSCFL